MEAITSRPLLLHAIATRVRHARQTTITVASSHARAIPAAKALRAVAIFLRELAKTAEQLTGLQRWRRASSSSSMSLAARLTCEEDRLSIPNSRITASTSRVDTPLTYISATASNEPIMREAEQRGLAYLFKLRLTANVKRMIERLATQREWTNAGQGWQAKESLLRLDGWSRQRRVIILRRRVKGALTMSSNETLGQQTLSFVEVGKSAGARPGPSAYVVPRRRRPGCIG